MNTTLTVTRPFHVRTAAKGRRELLRGDGEPAKVGARIPRVSRLMALPPASTPKG